MTELQHEVETAAQEQAAASAIAFRAALMAMAEPGRIERLPSLSRREAPGLASGARSLLALLADADAPWIIADPAADDRLIDAVAFDCSSRPAKRIADAAFICGTWNAIKTHALSKARIGDATYPDRGATLILTLDAINEGAHAALVSGPGLASPAEIRLSGVDNDFWRWVDDNRRRFPLGLDVYAVAGDQIMGLPRSLRVERVL